ncbi:MAG: GHKL domain-containing protein [Firmicutes bacterium]|nr:GHKL domain-containing protein [Bacillota bacterium]
MALEWILIEVFVNIVEVSVLFYLLCAKFSAKYRTFISTLLFILGNVVFLSLYIFISFRGVPIAEILVPSVCFIYLLLFRNGSILKKIFWIVVSFAILYSIAIFSATIIAVLSEVDSATDVITQSSSERLLGLIIAKTLQIAIFYILTKKKRNIETKNIISPKAMIVCFIVPLISFMLLLFIYSFIHRRPDIPEELIFPISVGYLVINIIVFVLYEIINREAEKNYILVAKYKQYELTEQHNVEVIKIYEKMRSWRHDYNNHMQLVVGILETDSGSNISEAIDYIKDLDEKIQNSSLEIITGNYIVDAIVSAKAALASAHNINFEHTISLPKDIAMENTDLCSILSNLLDNAIEACCKLSGNRYINFEMLTFRNQFSIRITNSTDGKYRIENGIFKTTKRGDLHGIGMGHVKSIVESYGGIMDAEPKPEFFTARISIPLALEAESQP